MFHPRHSFWYRFAVLNVGLVAPLLRRIAEELESVFPGSPKWATPVIFNPEGAIGMGEITVKDDQAPLSYTVTFVDAKGNPTSPDDVPQHTSSDESVVTVEQSEDGLSGTATIVGALGAAVVSVDSTDTDGTEIHAEGTVTVQSGEAVSGSVDFAQE